MPLSSLIPKAWPVACATTIVPSPGATTVVPVGSMPTPLPTVPALNTGSGTSSRGMTRPASGERTRVTAPGSRAVFAGAGAATLPVPRSVLRASCSIRSTSCSARSRAWRSFASAFCSGVR